MRILHISEAYPPAPGGVSGIMRILSEGLVRLGHEVTVATRSHPMRHSKVLHGAKIVDFNVRGKVDSGYRGDVDRYQDFVRSFPCDVLMVYAAQTWATDLVFPLLKNPKCATVFIPCGFSSLYHPDYIEYYRQMPEVLRSFDHIVYLDEFTRDYRFGQRHGIRHFSVIPECADLGDIQVGRRGFRRRYDIRTKHLLLNVGSYCRNKAQHFLLEAFFRAKMRDTTLVCIGPKPQGRSSKIYFRILQMMSFAIQAQLGLGAIRLLQGVDREWVVSAFHEADLFLLGSTFEVATPLVIYEAMGAGLPFVATNCGSLGELGHGGGLVVTDQSEMARAIKILLSDKGMRDELAEKGMRESKNVYSLAGYVMRFNELYHQLVSEKQGQ